MNPPVSALRPASDVPVDVQALDGVLAHLGGVIDTLDLDYLSRRDGDTALIVLAKSAAQGRGAQTVLRAASAEVGVRSDPARGTEGLAARLNFARASHLIEMVAGVSAATASRLMRVGSRTSPPPPGHRCRSAVAAATSLPSRPGGGEIAWIRTA